MRKTLGTLLVFMLFVMLMNSGVVHASAAVSPEEEQAVEQTVQGFYESLIAAYRGEDIQIVESYLDMNEMQSMNVLTALECISFSKQYMETEHHIVEEEGEYPYSIEFKRVEPVTEDEYKAIIYMDLEVRETYPPFLSEEEQTFYLRRLGDSWKIYRHDWSGIGMFEVFTDRLYEFDQEKRKAQLDEIASWSVKEDLPETGKTAGKEEDGSEGLRSLELPDDPPGGGLAAGTYEYNPVHGVSYAVDLATMVNPLFYDWNSYGGDCTNFVSQCVAYGLHNGGNRSLTSSYYYSSAWKPEFNLPGSNMWNSSVSWVGVNKFWAMDLYGKWPSILHLTVPHFPVLVTAV